LNLREDNIEKLDSVRPEKGFVSDDKYPEEPPKKKPRVEAPAQTVKTRTLLERTAFHTNRKERKIKIRVGPKVISRTFKRPAIIDEGIKTGVFLPEEKPPVMPEEKPPVKPERSIKIDRNIKPLTPGIQPPPLIKKMLPKTTTKLTPGERLTIRNKEIISRIGQPAMVETGGLEEKRLNWLDRFFLWLNKTLGSV